MIYLCSGCGRMTDNPAHPQLFCRKCHPKHYGKHPGGHSPNAPKDEPPLLTFEQAKAIRESRR